MTMDQPPTGDDDDDILVLHTWAEPGFRARVMIRGPEDAPQITMLARREDVLAYIRDWLDKQGPDSL